MKSLRDEILLCKVAKRRESVRKRLSIVFPRAWPSRSETIGADLISSEAVGWRFHPNSFGFHPAKQDFINSRYSSSPNKKWQEYPFYRPFTKIRNTRLGVPYFSFQAGAGEIFPSAPGSQSDRGADNRAKPSRQARLSARRRRLLLVWLDRRRASTMHG